MLQSKAMSIVLTFLIKIVLDESAHLMALDPPLAFLRHNIITKYYTVSIFRIVDIFLPSFYP